MDVFGGTASVGDAAHHQRGTGKCIACNDHVFGKSRVLRLEEAHGEQDEVCLECFLFPRGFHLRASSVCCGFPFHGFHLHAVHFSVFRADEAQGSEVPTALTSLFVA